MHSEHLFSGLIRHQPGVRSRRHARRAASRRSRHAANRLAAAERLEKRRVLAVVLDMVVVGDAGNHADSRLVGNYGAVADRYLIGKYEVTIGQYAEFLNAVAKSDSYGLYHPSMATDLNSAGIQRSGSSGSYTYAVMSNAGNSINRPITYVNWFDVARFANWMHNGQGLGSTETGAYTLVGGQTSGIAPAKNVGARFYIPTLNEWYKAAFYKGGGTTAGYWTHATQSDSTPGNAIGSTPNQANFYEGDYAVTQSPDVFSNQNYLTDVGAFTSSPSAYGTFDQAGNVWEWNDLTGAAGSDRGLHGGTWKFPASFGDYNSFSTMSGADVGTAGHQDNIGFRLAGAAVVPGAPVAVTGAPGNASVNLSWTAPASNGAVPITDYVVEYKTTAAATWTTLNDGVSATPAAVVTGLVNGTTYMFRVSAVNIVGSGAPTNATANVTPRTVPGQPTFGSGTPGNGQVSLTWTAPASNGGAAITDYVVEYKASSATSWSTFADGVSTALTAIVTGLTNGTSYVFRVSARNEAGAGAPTAASSSVTPRTAPGRPWLLSGSPGDRQVSLTWRAPDSNGGSAITDYVVEYKTSSASTWLTFNDGVSTATSATVTGLVNGVSYVFRVSAKNIAGTGSPNDASSSTFDSLTPRTVPGMPRISSVTAGDERVTLSWAAPTSNGGAEIDSYVVEYKTVAATAWTTFTTYASAFSRTETVTGLDNGESYSFRVSARNEAGTGLPFEASAVTLAAALDPPTGVVATAQRGYAIVSWTAPASDGGSSISSYVLQSSVDGGSTWSSGLTTAGGVTSARVDSLYDGATYLFRVKAKNSLGTSVPSTPSAAVTLPRQPGWPVQVGATGEDGVASLVTVGETTIVTGSFSGAVQFGGTTLTSAGGSEDVFVAKLNPDGSYAWAVQAGGTGSDRGTKIAALTDGTVAVIGSFTTSAAFGGTTLTSSGTDSFIAKISLADGTFAWARRTGDAGAPSANGIDALADGAMIVAGAYSGLATFGGTTLSTTGTSDAFVAKLDAAGSYVWTLRAGALSVPFDPLNPPSPNLAEVSPGGIAALPDGSAYVAGWFTGDVTFGDTTLQTSPGLPNYRSIFVAKVTQTGTFDWARQAVQSSSSSSTSRNEVSDVAVLGTDVLVAGTFEGQLDIADTSLSGSGTEVFLAQWSGDGSPVGALRVGGSGDDFGGSISDGFLTGVFDTSATVPTLGPWGQYEMTNLYGSSQQAFVAKVFSTDLGVFSWATVTPGSRFGGYGSPPDVAVLAGDPVIAGQFSSAAVFGATQLSTAGGGDGFVARMYSAPSNTNYPAWSYGGFDAVPTDVSGVPGNGQVGLTWLATSGSADYLVEYSSDGGQTWTTFNDGVSSASSTTVTGLANGTAYRFRVSAIDAVGVGRPSQLSAAMTPTLVRSAGWPKQAVGNSIDSLSVFGDGSVAVTGLFSGSGVFGSTTVTGTNPQVNGGMYAARLAADGAFSWARETPGGIAAAATGGATLVAGTKLMEYPATYNSMYQTWQPPFSATHMVVRQVKADGSTGWQYSEGATPWFTGMYPMPGYGSVVQPQSMTTLPDGSVVVAGMRNDYYSNSMSMQNDPIFFIQKINADGSAGWRRSTTPPSMSSGYGYYDAVKSLAAFSDGATLLAGTFGDQLPFGSSPPSPYPSPTSGRAFVTKLAADGTVAWSRQLGEFDPMMPYGNDVDIAGMTTLPDGSAVVVGGFSGTVTFGETTLIAADFSYGFIAKLAADGSLVWVQTLPFRVSGITTLTDGSVLAIGSFTDEIVLGQQVLTSAGDSDAFLLKISPSGGYTWSRRIGGTGSDGAGRIAALPDGSAIVTGSFSGTVAFGSDSLTSQRGTDTFIAKIGSDGQFITGNAAATVATSGALSALSTLLGEASTAGTVAITGTSLTAPIVATAPAGFEVSSDGTTFGTTATFTPIGGAVSGTLSVRIAAATAVGTYSGSVSLASSGATTATVAVPASTVTDELVFDVASGQSVTHSAARTGAIKFVKRGLGTLVLDALGTHTGLTSVEGGTLVVAHGQALAASAVRVNSGATLKVNSGVTMQSPSVTIAGGTLDGTGATLLVNATTGIGTFAITSGAVTGSPRLTVSGNGLVTLPTDRRQTVALTALTVDHATGGKLDVGKGRIDVAAGGITAANLRAALVAGRTTAGTFTGTTGIITTGGKASALMTNPAVGYRLLSSGAAIVAWAAYGDTNLDGQVNFSDISLINTGTKYGAGASTGAVWSQGDFNYSNGVNFTDINLLNTAALYGSGSYLPTTPGSVVQATAEPTSSSFVISQDTWIALAIEAEHQQTRKR